VATPAQGSPTRAATTFANWPTYHGNPARSGYAPTMPTATGPLRVTHRVPLDGQVYASPIVVRGQTVVATENNTVYRFDSTYGRTWQKHLGAPSPASERPCGNIDPLGITGTPVYDPAHNQVLVAAELGNPARHVLYALDFATGAVRWSHNIDLPGVDRTAMQERGGLTIVGAHVFVPFGGLAGDCGAYKGRVIAMSLTGTGTPYAYTVPTIREAGIWTPPGPTVDSNGRLFVSVGNGNAATSDPYDYSDSVLKLDASDLHRLSYFSPSTWRSDNAADLDLGSMGPALVSDQWILAVGKSGYGYLLAKTDLGGIGGERAQHRLCIGAYGGAAVVGRVVYVPCADGLIAVQVTTTPDFHLLWQADSAQNGSPVVGGGRVWTLDQGSGILYALDPATGATVTSIAVGQTSRFATPAIYGRRMIVPTLTGITVVSTS
jgi:outer membrane protein assembly factor BamB